jgi:hypothetical protein
LVSETPVVTADEVFAVNSKIRWVGLATTGGEVVLNQMRPNTSSHTPTDVDEEFITLGPLTVLGVAEKYSKYLKGVEDVVVHYGLVIHVFVRLGSQILDVSIEKDDEALLQFISWLNRKKSELQEQAQKR